MIHHLWIARHPQLYRIAGILIILWCVGCGIIANAPTPRLPVDVPAWFFLIDTQSFPPNWETPECTPSVRLCLGNVHALRSFGIPGVPGHVIQDVYRFSNVSEAQALFLSARKVDFARCVPQRNPCINFLPPPEINYLSPISDEYYLGCGIDVVPACEAIFRYGQYYAELYFDIDSGKGDGLQIQQVKPILRAVDERAASVLGIPFPTKAP